VVAGRNPVLESLRASVPATALYVARRGGSTDDRIAESVKLAAADGIPVLEADRPELDRLTGGTVHQGIALRVPPYGYAHPDDLTARAADAGQQPLIVALDGVTDAGNLGAVARSAAAFGAHGVLIPARRSAGVTAATWKASAGALSRLPVAQAPNLTRALAGYQKAGLFVAGLDGRGAMTVADLEVADGPLVLVAGAEGRGLSRLAAEQCDLVARIPIAAGTESLNVAVAAGIALYEISQRRSRR
jgi:23S rRNA (guanosine2251-2'-O)-methyltransferase